MCGIVGTVGREGDALEILVAGLGRLEYRGYDSAGIAVHTGTGLDLRRALGKLDRLRERLAAEPVRGPSGIGHTRWATHGKPSEANAHPHRAGRVALVHNGIIENYRELRAELEARGVVLASETDTEIIAHLIDSALAEGGDLLAAVRATCARLTGSFALAAIAEGDPEHLVAARNGGSPIILGLGRHRTFLASDIPAILPHTREMIFLEDGEFAVLSPDGVQIVDAAGAPVEREPRAIAWDAVSAEKGGYSHFMQKEIFEQPRAITDTIGTRVDAETGEVDLDGIDLSPPVAQKIERIALVACGTAHYACLVGRYLIEQLAGIPVDVDLASEFRYREPVLGAGTLVVPVSQSGETADTLAALREARRQGSRVLSICNVRDASIPRESDDVLYTHAGPEIGVASTKAFTTQLVALYLLALRLGLSRGRVGPEEARERVAELLRLPRRVEEALRVEPEVRRIAHRFFRASDFLFLGRGILYPIALEGALKLKEISYIHAEGYAAGEMKHGPIALIDENMPVVVLALRGPLYEKVISNIEQVRSRDGVVIAVASEGDRAIEAKADEVIRVPEIGPQLQAVLAVIPLQLLAYHVAVRRGTDVDQPRNLAKSVTVE